MRPGHAWLLERLKEDVSWWSNGVSVIYGQIEDSWFLETAGLTHSTLILCFHDKYKCHRRIQFHSFFQYLSKIWMKLQWKISQNCMVSVNSFPWVAVDCWMLSVFSWEGLLRGSWVQYAGWRVLPGKVEVERNANEWKQWMTHCHSVSAQSIMYVPLALAALTLIIVLGKTQRGRVLHCYC